MKNIIALLLVFFFCFSTTALSQNPQWLNYTNGDQVITIAVEGDFIWVGTVEGLVKINGISGEKTFFNKANSGLPVNTIQLHSNR